MNQIDLHVHSSASDGTYSPKEIILYAKEKGLAAVALTDHDTTQGLREANEEAKRVGIEFVQGIELSSEYYGGDIHVLGLLLEPENKEFQNHLKQFRYARDVRNEKMAEKLREQGFSITIEKMREKYQGAVLTRAHFAKYLKSCGYVETYEEAFQKYLNKNAPCYVPRTMISPQQAVDLILKANGIPILAHPLLYDMEIQNLKALIKELKKVGLMGIEGIYSLNTKREEEEMKCLADEMGLLLSGGSDFHGTTKPQIDLGSGRGDLNVPKELLTKLKIAKSKKDGGLR